MYTALKKGPYYDGRKLGEILTLTPSYVRGSLIHPICKRSTPLLITLYIYTGWPKKNGTVDVLGLCSDQQSYCFTLLERASFPHYNNTKIMKFG